MSVEIIVSCSVCFLTGALIMRIKSLFDVIHVDKYEYNFKNLKEKTENNVLVIVKENDKLKADIKELYKILETLTNESMLRQKNIDDNNNVLAQDTNTKETKSDLV